MDPEAFRAAGHEVVDLMADYLASVERFAVFPSVEPGSIAPSFPTAAPEAPEPIGAILDDYRRLVEPNATHWQHPGFLAYFGTTASGPGILGEMLTAALGQNAMLWRTSPIATELEGVVVGWLRQAVGLPDAFDGLITDTASTSSLIALAGARRGRRQATSPKMRVYASEEAHSSIEKACMTLGLGRGALVRIPTNDRFELSADDLRAAIARDRKAGLRPIAVVATVGHDVIDLGRPGGRCRRHRRARGPLAPRRRRLRRRRRDRPGAARAVPRLGTGGFDRHQPAQVAVHAARRVAPADPPDGDAARRVQPRPGIPADARSRDAGPRLQRVHAAARAAVPGAEAVDPAPLVRARGAAPSDPAPPRARRGVRVVDRRRPRLGAARARSVLDRLLPLPTAGLRVASEEALDELNARIMDAVNRTGEVFLSHTRLAGRFTIRLAVGNLRTEARHVERAWELLRSGGDRRRRR